MIRNILTLIIAGSLLTSACNTADDQEKARQDSIAEAAAADSMLQDALSADTIGGDTMNADYLPTDTIK